jgi:colanic acid biosynthesis glycosyl transferase WcaI
MVEKTGGGVVVAPDDPEALAEGLWQLWQDRDMRAKLARQAAAGARAHYSITKSAERLEQVCSELTQ